jgi:hypothetical protein
MIVRTLALALAATAVLAACDDDDDNGTGPEQNFATVRFVNASVGGPSLDIQTDGQVGTGNADVAFGESSSCVTVDVDDPGLSILEAGGTTAVPGFTPNFTADQDHTVLFLGGPGNTRFISFTDNVTAPTDGTARLRIINATSDPTGFDVFVNAPGDPLGTPVATNIGADAASGFLTIDAGDQQVRFTGTGATDVLLDTDALTFGANAVETIVIADPAAGTTDLRFFQVSGCP